MRKKLLVSLLAVSCVIVAMYWAWDWIEPTYRSVFPRQDQFQLVAVHGTHIVARLNTRTGSIALFQIKPRDVTRDREFEALQVGYNPGPFAR